MLLVMFRSGGVLYAVDARAVVEVVPRVPLRSLPHAPAELLGLLSYRGRVVPVIDFGVLTGSGPSRAFLSTRVILSRFRGDDGHDQIIGLVAEDVSRVANAGPGQVVSAPMSLDSAPYLGAFVRVEEGLVQMIEVGGLLTKRLELALFGDPAEPK